MARYVIYGAGSVGGIVGARLADAGHDVLLIARGPHYDALATSGLRIDSPDGTQVYELAVVDHPRRGGIQPSDVVVLAVKSQHTESALVALSDAAGPEVTVVCAQNGVENERTALRRFAQVYGCLVVLPASHLEPGVVTHCAGPVPGILDVGAVPAGRDDQAQRISEDLRAAGFASDVVEDVMAWKRRKLLLNLSNAIDALFAPSEATERLGDRAREEARACFAAARLASVAESAFEQRLAIFREQRYDERLSSGSSSWQSLARGVGNIEADYLNGEIVLLGRLHNIPTPVNAALQRLANEQAARHNAPGTLDVGAIDAMLAG